MVRFFFFFSFFQYFEYVTHSLLVCKVSTEKFTNSLVGVPLYVMSHFPLAAFEILFVFDFYNIITMCLHVDLFMSNPLGTLWLLESGCLFPSLDWGGE